MKKLAPTVFALLIFGNASFSQTIPEDSLYLGQTPPGNTPEVFNLAVSPGSFTAERIAISPDQKEIYYSVVKKYYPTSGDTIKYYRYFDNQWTGPFDLFNNSIARAFLQQATLFSFKTIMFHTKRFFHVKQTQDGLHRNEYYLI